VEGQGSKTKHLSSFLCVIFDRDCTWTQLKPTRLESGTQIEPKLDSIRSDTEIAGNF
jgi:hypothetical protein